VVVISEPRGAASDSRRLVDLRTRLLRLHKTLLDNQRGAYEAMYGPVASSGELLQLVIHHEQFAWLRAVSELISRIDEALDETEGRPADDDVESFFKRTRVLLRSDGHSPFETNYREALQRSSDVVMAHAEVIKLL
jgi:hypothetical protein